MKINTKLTLVVTSALICICIMFLSNHKNQIAPTSTMINSDNLVQAKQLGKDFILLYNTMYTHETYTKSRETMKSICCDELYFEQFEEEHHTGMPDTMENYTYTIEEVVCEYNLDENDYTVMLYATETFGSITYPYTAIIQVNDAFKVESFQKIQHRF